MKVLILIRGFDNTRRFICKITIHTVAEGGSFPFFLLLCNLWKYNVTLLPAVTIYLMSKWYRLEALDALVRTNNMHNLTDFLPENIRVDRNWDLKSDSHLPKIFVLFAWWKSFKNDENPFYFILKALPKIFKFLSRLFGHAGKRID